MFLRIALCLMIGLSGVVARADTQEREQQATPIRSIGIQPGFRVELLRSAGPDEDSWISMTFDDKGRLILGLDSVGVARIAFDEQNQVSGFQRVENTFKHCRGVLYAHDSLYVSATNSNAFYRLQDTNGDDTFDRTTLLTKLDYRSRFGHGPNQVVLGPDGMIYLVAGNDVAFPEATSPDSPYRDPHNDQLLPNSHDADQDDRVGCILRTDPEGKHWEVLAAGFRNQFDLAFNDDGEMFTYDADMEWDAGQPWYRPTRINHVIIGGEYGWRWGTGKWPTYYEDSLPSTLDMGLGSPTGMEFVGGSAFPPRFQKSMLVADWQNGRILAVDMLPKGATYQCRYEVLLEGGPLNVCDMEFGPDGALYFITGGRGSQSGLYRVTVAESNQPAHPGPTIQPTLTPEELKVTSADAEAAHQARTIRRKLEGVLFTPDSLSLDEIWPHLNSEDRWLRFAARTALERKDVADYKSRALAESQPHAAITGLIAVCRQGGPDDAADVLGALERIDIRSLDQQQFLGLLRAYELCFIRLGKPDRTQSNAVAVRLSPLYPARSANVNHMLCELLVYLGDDDVVARSVARLNGDITQEEQIRSARTLTNATVGWTAETREAYVGWLDYARRFQGGRQLTERIRDIRTDFEAGLSESERERLQPLLTKLDQPLEDGLVQSRPIVERWKMDMLAGSLTTAEMGRSFDNGQKALLAANCLKCHRIGSAGGQIGPDLSAVGRRFDTRTILESIIEPSRVMDPKYRHTAYVLTTGKVVTGRPVGVSKTKITVETDPLKQTTVEIIRSEIEEAVPATVSPMPSGLADVLTREELFDLLAYLKAGGDPGAPVFQSTGAGN